MIYANKCFLLTYLLISTLFCVTVGSRNVNYRETSPPKVIWGEGRVAVLSHTYAVKSPIEYNGATEICHKNTPSRGPIAKPHHLPHPWTRPTYDAKRHPDPIRRFFPQCTGQADRRTDRQIVHGKSLTTTGRCALRATQPKTDTSGAWLIPACVLMSRLLKSLLRGTKGPA